MSVENRKAILSDPAALEAMHLYIWTRTSCRSRWAKGILVAWLWLRMRPIYRLIKVSLGANAENYSAEFNSWWSNGGAPEMFVLDDRRNTPQCPRPPSCCHTLPAWDRQYRRTDSAAKAVTKHKNSPVGGVPVTVSIGITALPDDATDILMLGKAVESRDPPTGGHVERVSHLGRYAEAGDGAAS